MERYTQNDLDYMRDLGHRICDSFGFCSVTCPFYTGDKDHTCILNKLRAYLAQKIVKTNADKFKEVFGFPLYEVHQLSVQEEGEWLEHEYQEPDKIDEE